MRPKEAIDSFNKALQWAEDVMVKTLNGKRSSSVVRKEETAVKDNRHFQCITLISNLQNFKIFITVYKCFLTPMFFSGTLKYIWHIFENFCLGSLYQQ